jgi:hypothetical protein
VPQLDARTFLESDFAGRIRLANHACGQRLWSSQLAEIWAGAISQAIALTPDDSRTIQDLLREAMILGAELDVAERSYRLFVDSRRAQEVSNSAKIVYLIISCRKYLDRATALLSHLASTLKPAFVVIGDERLRDTSWKDEFLTVPASDGYEGLPRKVLETLLAVRRAFGRVAVLKLDDDARMIGPPNVEAVDNLVATVEYAGIPVGHGPFDRCWHVGKCEHRGDLPYGKRLRGPWAAGGIYFLGPQALDCVVRDYLFFPDETLGEMFEDKLVGDILRAHSIPFTPAVDLAPMFGIDLHREPDTDPPTLTLSWQ